MLVLHIRLQANKFKYLGYS